MKVPSRPNTSDLLGECEIAVILALMRSMVNQGKYAKCLKRFPTRAQMQKGMVVLGFPKNQNTRSTRKFF